MNLPAETASLEAIEKVLVQGDLSQLSPLQRVSYMGAVCRSLGLNPLTKPLEFIKLNGRLVLYARRDCAEQLRKLHGVSITDMECTLEKDVYCVKVKAQDKTGRTDRSIGAVGIAGISGEALANAFMKAETKAKRRVTLSICGLGMLDETEVETISGVESKTELPKSPVAVPPPTGEAEHGASPPFPPSNGITEWSLNGKPYRTKGLTREQFLSLKHSINPYDKQHGKGAAGELLRKTFGIQSSLELTETQGKQAVDLLALATGAK